MKQYFFIVVITLMMIGVTVRMVKPDVPSASLAINGHYENVSDQSDYHTDFMTRYVEFDQSGGGVLVLAAFLFVTTSGLTLVINRQPTE